MSMSNILSYYRNSTMLMNETFENKVITKVTNILTQCKSWIILAPFLSGRSIFSVRKSKSVVGPEGRVLASSWSSSLPRPRRPRPPPAPHTCTHDSISRSEIITTVKSADKELIFISQILARN